MESDEYAESDKEIENIIKEVIEKTGKWTHFVKCNGGMPISMLYESVKKRGGYANATELEQLYLRNWLYGRDKPRSYKNR